MRTPHRPLATHVFTTRAKNLIKIKIKIIELELPSLELELESELKFYGIGFRIAFHDGSEIRYMRSLYYSASYIEKANIGCLHIKGLN